MGGPIPLPPALGPALDGAGSLLALLPEGFVWAFMLAFARLGTATMLLPGLGELWVAPRLRLGFGLALTFLVLPAVFPVLPAAPESPAQAALALGHEVLMGAVIGFAVRAVTMAVMVTGALVALQSGLANALQPGVVTPDATTILGVFLGLAVIAFMANTGLDHLVLQALVESYTALPPLPAPGLPPAAGGADLGGSVARTGDWGGLVELVVRTAADAFALGFWLSLPVLVATLLLNLGLGLANRFMQQLQAYFLTVPLAILVALGLLGLALPAILIGVDRQLRTTLASLVGT